MIGIFLTLTSNSCRPLPIYTENTTQTNNAISRYGIRHILGIKVQSKHSFKIAKLIQGIQCKGVQHTRVTNVAATGVTCGPTGKNQFIVFAIQIDFEILKCQIIFAAIKGLIQPSVSQSKNSNFDNGYYVTFLELNFVVIF